MKACNRNHRTGATLIELVVAAILLSAMITFLGTLVVRTARMTRDSRHSQLAMDELTNQLERLTILPSAQIESAIQSVTVSDEIKSSLPDATIEGEFVEDNYGRRIVLNIDWRRRVPAKPLTLVGWIPGNRDSDGTPSDSPQSERETEGES